MNNLFVYGTLLTGHGNWSWALAPQKGEPKELSGAKLYDLGAYPGMKHSDDENSLVKGELFQISDEQLARIDGLEGYREYDPEHSHYIRELVTLTDGTESYTYFYNGSPNESRLIPEGEWK